MMKRYLFKKMNYLLRYHFSKKLRNNHVVKFPSVFFFLQKDTADKQSCMKNGTSPRENGTAPQENGPVRPHVVYKSQSSLPNGVHQPVGATVHTDTNGHLSPNDTMAHNGINMKIKSVQDIWALQARKRQLHKAESICKSDYARPLYRKDIFYSGSILHIPEFHSQPNVKSYLRSTTSIPYTTTSPTSQTSLSPARLCGCIPKSAADTLRTMLDMSLFKDPVFLIACIGNALGMLGLYVPFVFMADRAIVLGVVPNQAAFLLSVIGE